MIRFMTYNLLNYGWDSSASELARREKLHQIIREADPDVLAVQEIRPPEGEDVIDGSRRLVRELAAATGLECDLGGGEASVAIGNTSFSVALLWKKGLVPVQWQARSGIQFWHSMASLAVDIDGRHIVHHSFHATPFGRARRADEAERVLSVMTRFHQGSPAIIGADWNVVSADRVQLSGESEFYDPDPYQAGDWYADLVYQCLWTTDRAGKRQWSADRTPGDVLCAGGIKDAAVVSKSPWMATTGHWPDDPYQPRRIDAIKMTEQFAPALKTFHVIRNDLTLSASDHLPVICEYEPKEITRNKSN